MLNTKDCSKCGFSIDCRIPEGQDNPTCNSYLELSDEYIEFEDIPNHISSIINPQNLSLTKVNMLSILKNLERN